MSGFLALLFESVFVVLAIGVELALDWRDARRARQPRPLPSARIVRRR